MGPVRSLGLTDAASNSGSAASWALNPVARRRSKKGVAVVRVTMRPPFADSYTNSLVYESGGLSQHNNGMIGCDSFFVIAGSRYSRRGSLCVNTPAPGSTVIPVMNVQQVYGGEVREMDGF